MAITTTSSLSGLFQVYYEKRFLEQVRLMTVYDIGAKKQTIPMNSGKVVYFNRYTRIPVVTTPLDELTGHTAIDASTSVVSATVAPYGQNTTVSTLFKLTSIDEGLKGMVDNFAINAKETIDTLIKIQLSGSATTQLAGGKSNITDVATTDVLTGAEIRKAVKTLKQNGAMKFEDGYFKSIVPVTAVYDLMGNTEWQYAYKYTQAENLRNGEVGRLYGVTFYETNNEVSQSSTTTVYTTFVFGKEAYATIDVGSAGNVRINYVPATPSAYDPHALKNVISWTVNAFAAKVLNADWIIGIKTGTQS